MYYFISSKYWKKGLKSVLGGIEIIWKIHKFGNTQSKAYRSTDTHSPFVIDYLSKVVEENISEIFSETK